ncbi:MAG: AmmeMemoRadiSam system protein B [Planctomycetota bacterium]|nr:AmmeMemoRadiSam system protein B [Planctomycetota bacterium]
MSARRPKIRPVEVISAEVGGKPAFCLRDPDRIAPDPVVLGPVEFMLAAMMDGTRTILEIQAEVSERTGEIVPRHAIEEVVELLDREYYLDGPRFRARAEAIVEEFRTSKVRRSVHAGTSAAYPDDPDALMARISEFFRPPEGPGPIDGTSPAGKLKAVIAPHIDLQRGGPCFAHAYKALASESDADLFVILGIAHNARRSLFILTKKDFQTPLGTAKTDAAFVERLEKASLENPYAEEMVHRLEHSVEFQVVFLQAVLGRGSAARNFEIVPVLCGSFQGFLEEDGSPLEDARVRAFVDGLRDAIEKSGRKWCIVASVDLSHVGRKFGHGTCMSPGTMRMVEFHDRMMLHRLVRCDTAGFLESLRRDRNARNVDAVSAAVVLLEASGAERGRLLKYCMAYEAPTRSAVSFASMSFY